MEVNGHKIKSIKAIWSHGWRVFNSTYLSILFFHSGLFFFIFVFSIQMIVTKNCRWLVANCGFLVSETIKEPTEPLIHCPLFSLIFFWMTYECWRQPLPTTLIANNPRPRRSSHRTINEAVWTVFSKYTNQDNVAAAAAKKLINEQRGNQRLDKRKGRRAQ